MKLGLSKVLLATFILTIVLFVFIYFFRPPALLIILGIPFLLFFPGFTLIAAIAPKYEDMSTTERIILSFILSIVVDSIIGLVLNYTPFGITLDSVTITGTIFTELTTIVGLVRQATLPRNERAFLGFNLYLARPFSGVLNTVFTVLMVLIIAGALVTGLYFAFAQKSNEAFTQFYIVKQNGSALYSPSKLAVGDDVSIIVGITNHEGTQVNYRIQVLWNGESYDEISPIMLLDGQQRQDKITFPIESTGEKLAECLLYKNNETMPYLKSLRVWIGSSESAIASER